MLEIVFNCDDLQNMICYDQDVFCCKSTDITDSRPTFVPTAQR